MRMESEEEHTGRQMKELKSFILLARSYGLNLGKAGDVGRSF